ncbi:MAG: hypothetical protein U1E27_04735 [Kiritimatiellia bacterium]|nr:hypothetical protein [Kiritimatiellia bacterium]
MEKGTRALIWMLAIAVGIGGIVLIAHPLYRGTVRAWLRGQPAASPIRLSNERALGGDLDEGGLHDLAP